MNRWFYPVFLIVAPLIWLSDVLSGREQFRVRIAEDAFSSRLTWRMARQEAAVRDTSVYWRRFRRWKKKHH